LNLAPTAVIVINHTYLARLRACGRLNMRIASRAARNVSLPVPLFPLYGEAHPPARPSPELVHCETIASRSRLHDWVIRPHRHADLAQLLWISRGSATVHLDGVVSRVQGPMLQYVPRLCVHGFSFSPDVQGHVLTLATPIVEYIARELGASSKLRDPIRMTVGREAGDIGATCDRLAEEFGRDRPSREPMMRALCLQLMVQLLREGKEQPSAPPETGARSNMEERMNRFRELVEQHYLKHLPVGHFAQRLGVSEASLNRTCRELAGTSAQGLLHQRLLLEASRNLIYTNKPIQVIAEELGFSDPAYFSRFFSRAMGCSPRHYRVKGSSSLVS
jgi:AraC family transcriptional activator of pobA